MSLLDPVALANARATHELTMRSTVVIKTQAASTRDGSGNYVAGSVADVTTKGSIGELTAQEAEVLGLALDRRYFHLHLPAGTSIDPRYSVIVDNVGYEVSKVLSPDAPEEVTKHVVIYRG